MALGTAAIEAQAAAWPEIRELALSREVPPSLSSTALVQGELQADEYRVGSTFFEFYGVPIRARARVRGRRRRPGSHRRRETRADDLAGCRSARTISPDRQDGANGDWRGGRDRAAHGRAGSGSTRVLRAARQRVAHAVSQRPLPRGLSGRRRHSLPARGDPSGAVGTRRRAVRDRVPEPSETAARGGAGRRPLRPGRRDGGRGRPVQRHGPGRRTPQAGIRHPHGARRVAPERAPARAG